MDAIKNFAKATVTDNNYDASATSIDVITGHAGRLPPAPFNAVWWNATDYPDPSDDPTVEIVRVTAVSTDTLTITRGQEGTAAEDHNLAGKTYFLIAGMTARTITELVGNIFTGANPYIAVDVVNDTIELASNQISIGDIQGLGNSAVFNVNDTLSLGTFSNLNIGTTQIESATVAVGTLAGKLAIYNAGGTLVGYLPIYTTIT